MAKRRKPKCTVVFSKTSRGPDAVLYWRGRSLNAMNYPKGHVITAGEKRAARKRLMAGCAEMVRSYQRSNRFDRTRR